MVNALGEGLPTVGDVARDGVAIGGVDLPNFLQRRLVIEIQVLKADQERRVSAREGSAHRQPQQADQGARLLVASVLGEARDDVPDGRVERVRLTDALDEGLRRRGDRVDALRLLERVHVGLGDLVDAVLPRQPVEQALADDREDLACVLLHRGDGLRVLVVVLGRGSRPRCEAGSDPSR